MRLGLRAFGLAVSTGPAGGCVRGVDAAVAGVKGRLRFWGGDEGRGRSWWGKPRLAGARGLCGILHATVGACSWGRIEAPRVAAAARKTEAEALGPEGFFRWHWRGLALGTLLAGMLVAGMLVGGWLYRRSDCATLTGRAIRGPGLYDAKVVERPCSFSDTVSVVLGRRGERRGVTVLKYELDDASRNLSLRDAMPVVTWLDRDHLKMSLRAAGSISTKLMGADGVHVEYDIGVVEFR